MSLKAQKYTLYILTAFAVSLLLFYRLSDMPVILWDESRQAINALEMFKSGKYLVTTYNNLPDLYNTKPPLLIWLQTCSFHLFGTDTFALRLPSALAGFFTCLMIFRFAEIHLKSLFIAISACFILITFKGYIEIHAARTGDYDALLTLFTTGYILNGYLYLTKGKLMHLHFTVLFILFAVMTKGVAGLLLLPVLPIAAIALKSKINYKFLLIDAGVIIVIISGYYFFRNQASPGYLSAIIKNELGGRYLAGNDGHSGGFWFYILTENPDNKIKFLSERFSALVLLIIYVPFLLLQKKYAVIRKFSGYLLFSSIWFFIVISASGTKLYWYDVPLMPLTAILSAVSLWWIKAQVTTKIHSESLLKTISVITICAVITLPYFQIFYKVKNDNYADYDKDAYGAGRFFAALNKQPDKSFNDFIFLNSTDYMPQIDFYLQTLSLKGIDIKKGNLQTIKSGDSVIIHQQSMKAELEKSFICRPVNLFKNNSIECYVIENR